MSKSPAVKQITRLKMHSWDLIQVDDLCKLLALDPYIGFPSRKINKNSILSTVIKKQIEDTIKEHDPINKQNIKLLRSNLIQIVTSNKLYIQFNIQTLKWIEFPLEYYLRAQSSDSMVAVKECNRYKGDDYKGVMVIAKSDIQRHTKLNFVTAIYKAVDPVTQRFLESQRLDFSIMKSNMTKYDVIMLGPAALINHDCSPNCKYDAISKSSLRIITTQYIKAGQELYCDYGPGYFGLDNEECACQTCEAQNKGYFSNKKEIINSLPSSQDQDITQFDHWNCNHEFNNCSSLKSLAFNINISSVMPVRNIIFSLDLVNVVDLCKHIAIHSRNKFNNIVEYRNYTVDYVKLLAQCYFSHIYQIFQSMSGSYSVVHGNGLKSLSIEEMNLDHSLVKKSEENENIAIKKFHPKLDLGSAVMQWCQSCHKGAICNISNKWHSSNCSGQLQIRNNSIPFVLLRRPEEIPGKRRPFCQFCGSFVHQYPRHLETNHSTEPKVKEMMEAKSCEERLKLLSSLRNRGYNVYYKLTKNMIPCRSIRKGAENVTKVECKTCGSFLSKSTLWHHACPNKL